MGASVKMKGPEIEPNDKRGMGRIPFSIRCVFAFVFYFGLTLLVLATIAMWSWSMP